MSLGEFLGPMQEIGMKFKTRPRTSRNLVFKSKTRLKFMKLACYHGAASTYCGENFVPFGAGSGISFSQTRASHNKRGGFGRERVTFGDGTISVASYCCNFFLVLT